MWNNLSHLLFNLYRKHLLYKCLQDYVFMQLFHYLLWTKYILFLLKLPIQVTRTLTQLRMSNRLRVELYWSCNSHKKTIFHMLFDCLIHKSIRQNIPYLENVICKYFLDFIFCTRVFYISKYKTITIFSNFSTLISKQSIFP